MRNKRIGPRLLAFIAAAPLTDDQRVLAEGLLVLVGGELLLGADRDRLEGDDQGLIPRLGGDGGLAAHPRQSARASARLDPEMIPRLGPELNASSTRPARRRTPP